MEQIVIDGVRYEKASKLAKDFRYTTDYIGQLCRSGKVDAKLVGRSWFVNPETLKQHKQNRYQKNSGSGTSFNNKPESDNEKQQGETKAKHFLNKIVWNPVSYETDDAELLPNLKKGEQSEPTKLSVTPAEASDLDIEGEADDSESFRATPLPEVSLTGTLKVESLDTYFDPNEGEEAPPPSSTVQLRNASGAVGMRRKPATATAAAEGNRPCQSPASSEPQPSKSGKNQGMSDISINRDNKQINDFLDRISEKGEEIDERKKKLKAARQALRTPVRGSAPTKVAQFSPASVAREAGPQPRSSFLLVHISILLSAGVIVLLWSLDSHVVSDSASASTSLQFSFEHIRELFGF